MYDGLQSGAYSNIHWSPARVGIYSSLFGKGEDDLLLELSALVPGCFIDLSGVCVDCKRKRSVHFLGTTCGVF